MSFFGLCLLIIVVFYPNSTTGSRKLKMMKLERTVDFGINVGGSTHPCYRPCEGAAMVCEYNMTLSLFSTLGLHCGDCPRTRSHCSNPGCIVAGGTSRPVYVANLMLPGPAIYVCEGDTVRVRAENAFANAGVTLHWHGVWMKSTPHMDGVPYVSQCPIQPNNVFEYSFRAQPAGTHMWHAHIGLIDTDGMFGPLVIRRSSAAEPHLSLYDEDVVEHTLMLWHWYPQLSDAYLPVRLFRNESVAGAGILINGKGVMAAIEGQFAPWEEIRVQQGKRYRLRLVYNSAVYCPVQVSVDNHTLTAIASDGAGFKPVEVDSLMLNAGERWDVVLSANQAVNKYWLRVRSLGDCGEDKTRVIQQAVITYDGTNAALPTPPRPEFHTSDRDGKLLNPMQVVSPKYMSKEVIHVSDLENLEESTHGDIAQTPNRTMYLLLNFQLYSELAAPGPYPQNNGISFEFPDVPLILQRYEKTASESICSLENAHQHCIGTYCSCTYIEKVPLGELVEVVLVDLSLDRNQDHPYHIHGTNFHVVAEASIGANLTADMVRDLNEKGLIKKRLSASAPLKDTVTVPSQGYVVIRFRATNPGYWIFHCHISNHFHLGMAMLLQFGEDSDMPAVPQNFPRCGDWSFTPDESRSSSEATIISSVAFVLIIIHSLGVVQSVIRMSSYRSDMK